MKIAVTGGNGFIGKAVIAKANEMGHEAWSFDRADGNDVLGNLDSLNGAEAVIHLAGVLGTHELFEDPEHAVDVNITGSLRVMQHCISENAFYVQITMPDVFPSIYTATKVATQRLAGALAHSRKLRHTDVVAYNAFGPGQAFGPGHPQKIIPTFALAGWRNEPIPVWGDGTQTVDLVHVDTVAEVLLRAATEQKPGERLHAGSSFKMTVMDVARFVEDHTKSRGGILLLPMRDGEIPTEIVSPVSLGLSLDKLRETIEWYRQFA